MQRGGSSSSRGGGRGGGRGGSNASASGSASASSSSSGGSGFASSAAFAAAYASTPDLGCEPVVIQSALKKTKLLEGAPTGLFRKDITCSGRTPIKGSQAKKFRQLVQESETHTPHSDARWTRTNEVGDTIIVSLLCPFACACVCLQSIYRHVTDAEWLLLFPPKFAVHTEKLSGALLTEHKPLLYWVKDEGDGCASKSDLGSPMWIDLSGGHADAHMVYPTLYALAKVASILRPLTVHAPVSKFAIQGADVMWPGVIVDDPQAEHGVGRFQQGEKRAVFARGNPAPFAVGWLAQDSAAIIAAAGKGKAVSIVHVFGDALWNVGNRQPPNIGFQPKQVYGIKISGAPDEEEEESDEDAEQQQQQQQEAGVEASLDALQVAPVDASSSSSSAASSSSSSSSAIAASSAATPADSVPGSWDGDDSSSAAAAQLASTDPTAAAPVEADDELKESSAGDAAEDGGGDVDDDNDGEEGEEGEAEDAAESSKLSTAAMDAALLRCFLLAIQTRIRDSDLPMSPSSLLSVMEACNVDTDTERLDVRRSSHRKLAKFLKQLGKLGLAKSKTGAGKQGMCSTELALMAVSRTSPLLKDVQVTQAFLDAVKKKQKAMEKSHAKSAAESSASSSSLSSSSTAAGSSSSSGGGALQILHLYKPDQKLQRLFADADGAAEDPKKLWSMKDAKAVLWGYTLRNSLDLAASSGRVRLDPLLFDTLYADSGRNVNEVTKADLAARFDSHLQDYYAIVHGDQIEADQVKFTRGPLPPISVSLEQRDGKKKMTRVTGVEQFGLDPTQFAREAQKMFACAATCQEVPASSKHKAFKEVLIQGDVTKDIGPKLQQMYGIPASLVKQIKKGK